MRPCLYIFQTIVFYTYFCICYFEYADDCQAMDELKMIMIPVW